MYLVKSTWQKPIMNDDGKITLIFYEEAVVFAIAIITLMNNIVSDALNYDVILANSFNQRVASAKMPLRKQNCQISEATKRLIRMTKVGNTVIKNTRLFHKIIHHIQQSPL